VPAKPSSFAGPVSKEETVSFQTAKAQENGVEAALVRNGTQSLTIFPIATEQKLFADLQLADSYRGTAAQGLS